MTDKVIDPVCGMEVDPEKASEKADYQGHTYFFCAPGCKVQFEQEPNSYLEKQET